MNQPLVSVITVSFNSAKTIEKTISSIRLQSYKNIQYIVVDGKSSDGTTAIIEKNLDIIDYYTSEPDQGIYDAWNKALKQVRGEIVCFLNSDDWYHNDSIGVAVEALRGKTLTVSYGSTVRCNVEGMPTDVPSIAQSINRQRVESNILRGFGFWHVSVFATKDCFESVGAFDTNYRVAGDFDWLLRALLAGVKFVRTRTVTFMRVGGISEAQRMLGFRECMKSAKKNNVVLNKTQIIRAYLGVKLGGSQALRRLIGECKVLGYSIFNRTFNILPSFALRVRLLRLLGAKVGNNVTFHRTRFIGRISRLVIGDQSTVNQGCTLDLRGGLVIGRSVTIAEQTKILTAGHDLNCASFSYITKPVQIDDFSVIYANCLICPGVTVGRAGAALSGAVVAKDIEAGVIVAGNPAAPIRERAALCLEYSAAYPIIFD